MQPFPYITSHVCIKDAVVGALEHQEQSVSVMKRLNDLLREYPILVLPIVAVLVVTLSLHSSIYLHSASDSNSDSPFRAGIHPLFTHKFKSK